MFGVSSVACGLAGDPGTLVGAGRGAVDDELPGHAHLGRGRPRVEGDDGIPSLGAWVLAREPRADDARMLELLEPYRPHRYRVVRLAFRSGLRPPRRGPRRQPHDIGRR